MDSPAERDWFARWRWIVAGVTIFLLVLQALLMGPIQGRSLSRALVAEVLAAVIPNFIAGLVAAFTVYLFVRDGDRSNYVRAMRALRTSTLSLLDAGKIQATDVRSLMKAFVPTVSQLYFKTDQSLVRDTDQNLNFTKRQCFSCRQPSEVRAGRCKDCHDVLDSWQEEERDSGQAASQ